MTTDTQFLTPKEVAEILGVHQKTVHNWLRTGKITGTKISYRAWRIPHLALENFVAQNSNARPRKTVQGTDASGPEIINPNDTMRPDVPETSPGSKMKHYLRDIMGEDSSGNTEQG
jgi:excisionase family DNA binding protein